MNGAAEQTAVGMGVFAAGQPNASFMLAAGQARAANFTFTRPGATGNAPGAAFNVDFTVAEMVSNGTQMVAGAQARVALANVACSCGAIPAAGAAAATKAPATGLGSLKKAVGAK
jgi:hypothetical protein